MDFWTVFIAVILAVITYILCKFFMSAWEEGRPLDYKKDVKLTGKTVLITGANCGLGKAAALDLATRGARVVLACRNKEKAEAAAEEIKKETGNQDVSIIILDLSDLDSVKVAAENVIKTYDRLDVLINNAGIGLTDTKHTKQGFDITFGTNYLGHFLFTQLLLDLLKKSAPSRIINVSSMVLIYAVRNKLNYDPTSKNGEVKYPSLRGYIISKLANYFHVKTLSDELKGTGVTANAVHPGCVETQMMKRDTEDKKKAFMNKIFLVFAKVFARTEKDGSQTIVHAAVDPELEQVTGEYFANMIQSTDKLTTLAKDGEEAERLSKFSYDVCQDYLPIRPLAAQDIIKKKTDDDKWEDEQEEQEPIVLQPRKAAFVTYAVEELATIGEVTGAEDLDDKKEDEQEEKEEEFMLQPTEAVEEIATIRASTESKEESQFKSTEASFVTYAVEEIATIHASKEESQFKPTEASFVTDADEEIATIHASTESKEESQFKPTEAAFDAVEEIATIGASTYVRNLEDESPSAPLNNKSREASPVRADITVTPSTTTVEETSTSIVDDEI